MANRKGVGDNTFSVRTGALILITGSTKPATYFERST